jgi:hypothetical protein
MSRTGDEPLISPPTRGLLYVVTGVVVSLPHYATVPHWYRWAILVLGVVSVVCYIKYERKNGTNLIFVIGVSAGLWLDALVAWQYGRLSHDTIVFLATATITALIWAAYTDFKQARGR